MTTLVEVKPRETGWHAAAWLPLAVLPAAAGAITAASRPWVQMWALAMAIYGSLKWLTLAMSPAGREATLGRAAGYLFLWTGMDAEAFFDQRAKASTRWSEWAWAIVQTAAGFWLLVAFAPLLTASHPLVAGWVAMTGIVSILHFGVSQLLSLAWRTAGVNARHIMHKPLLATSLADFWSRRWNLAFRDLVHRFVLRPLVPAIGVGWATMAVFLVSGLLHDVVISLAARGGWGMPTLYFLIQGVALLLERSPWGKSVGLGRGIVGWLFAAAIIIGPVGLLFHPPFVTRVVVPMVEALAGALR
jgi:Membrane bound O-acyl transferase family